LFDSFIPPNKFYKKNAVGSDRAVQSARGLQMKDTSKACVHVVPSNVCSVILGLLEAYTLKFQQYPT
jgi:hypothetical protein